MKPRPRRIPILIIEGSDGVQEAARLALENDIPLRFLDPLPLRYPLFEDKLPDAYLIDSIGQKIFLDLLVGGTRLTGKRSG